MLIRIAYFIMQNYTLQSHQTLSEISQINLAFHDLIILSQPGTGKTYWALHTLPLLFPEQKILVLVPYQSIAKQKSEEYQIHGVYAGSRANQDKIQIAVYDCLDLSNTILVIDEYHQLTLSQNYRQPALERILERCETSYKNIFLSGTKVKSYHPQLRSIEEIYVIPDVKKEIEYVAVKPKDILQSIMKRLNSEHVNVVYMNKRQTCEVYAKYVQELGFSPRVLSSENKNSEEFQYILKNKKFPENINVIFTTAVFSEGIDIYEERPISLFHVTHDDPASIKQVLSRFRNRYPEQFFVVYRKDPSIDHFYCPSKQYFEQLEKEALQLATAINLVKDSFKQKAEFAKKIRTDLMFDKGLLIKEKENEYLPSYSGISYLIRQREVRAFYKNEKSLEREMKRYGMICIRVEQDSDILECPGLLKELKSEKKEEVIEQQKQYVELSEQAGTKVTKVFQERVQQMKEVVEEYLPVEKINEIVKRVVEMTQGSSQKLNLAKKQLEMYVQLTYKKVDPFFAALRETILQHQEFVTHELLPEIQQVYKEFGMYCTVRLNEYHIMQIVKSFVQVKRIKKKVHDEYQNYYRIISDNPLEGLLKEVNV